MPLDVSSRKFQQLHPPYRFPAGKWSLKLDLAREKPLPLPQFPLFQTFAPCTPLGIRARLLNFYAPPAERAGAPPRQPDYLFITVCPYGLHGSGLSLRHKPLLGLGAGMARTPDKCKTERNLWESPKKPFDARPIRYIMLTRKRASGSLVFQAL